MLYLAGFILCDFVLGVFLALFPTAKSPPCFWDVYL